MVDAEILFDLLQMEVVSFYHGTSTTTTTKNEANTKLEHMGFRVGQALIEKFTKDQARFKDELDLMKFVCKDFWVSLFSKQIDNLRTNRQGVYILNDNSFKLLSKISGGKQYGNEGAKYVAFPCGLIRGALAGLGVTCYVTADTAESPVAKFQVEIHKS